MLKRRGCNFGQISVLHLLTATHLRPFFFTFFLMLHSNRSAKGEHYTTWETCIIRKGNNWPKLGFEIRETFLTMLRTVSCGDLNFTCMFNHLLSSYPIPLNSTFSSMKSACVCGNGDGDECWGLESDDGSYGLKSASLPEPVSTIIVHL